MTTVNLVYQATVVGLDPFQLVLVGTVLELSAFLFEVPTGVIADTYSRKLSVIIGVFLVGLGFMVGALFPTFLIILLSQVIWGIGYTFISGAREAWVADEIGEKNAGKAFLKGQQFEFFGAIIGIVFAVTLAIISIRLPIFIGGLLYSLQAIFLYLFMKEDHFHRSKGEGNGAAFNLFGTLREGLSHVRAHRILPLILVIGFFVGMYSEGFDRLWTPFMLNTFELPTFFNLPPIVWFGVMNGVALFISTFGLQFLMKHFERNNGKSVVSYLFFVNVGVIISTIIFALSGNFYLALAFYFSVRFFNSIHEPLYSTWLNQHLDSKIRATVFSLSAQANSFGQIIGGPFIGLLAVYFSISVSFIVGALLLLPLILLYMYSERRI